MSQVIQQETGKEVVALSGPSHAEEVSRGIPTGVVAACVDKSLAEKVQQTFVNEALRVYTCPDTIGVELGAAHKNVIALCAGICDGMGYGDNTKALLMTRGLAELARLGMAMGAKRETFAGLAGVGDLIVTCTSMHSRNRRGGILIGKGKTAQEAMKEVGAVVEGYYAAKSAWELAQLNGVEMPITQAAYEVLYENKDPHEAINHLMLRSQTSEVEDAAWAR
jgi:glycerol-3-phosphate dehydrogenase (NAD(P)+)